MSFLQASQRGTYRAANALDSYAEISRFLRTRCHGTTPRRRTPLNCLFTCRSISSSRHSLGAVNPDAGLQRSLQEFKSTISRSSWTFMDQAWSPGVFSEKKLDAEIEIFGYLGTRRDVNKNLSFAILRNKSQDLCIQLVSSASGVDQAAEAHAFLKLLREWTPVIIRGRLVERKPSKSAEYQGMQMINDREIALEHIEALNDIPKDIIIKDDTVFGPDQRHLELRTSAKLREDILFRSKVTQHARSRLIDRLWSEIETPILFKSTPEGAREFLVPTRQRGLAYALPQSPQQYKQILMASGINKYFQFARCFRDEDLRADRQPEFTQLDMEMAFAGDEDVMNEIEFLVKDLWNGILRHKLPERLPRMSYQTAMELYGSDKPDLRYTAKIQTITQYLPADLIGKITPIQNPIVDAVKIPVSESPKITRNFVSQFLDSPAGKDFLENPHGQPGIFVCDPTQPMQGLGPLGYQFIMEGPQGLEVDPGDLLVLQARPNAPLSGGSTKLGDLRLALYKAAIAQSLIDAPASDHYEFVWVTDFPLFTPHDDSSPGQGGTAGFSSTHHPFTAPKTPEDVDLLVSAPEKAIAAHYDLVLNGVELGGGSRRIHNAAVQEFIFRDVLKMPSRRIEDFRHLLDALRSGCPPHAGIALGWDRLMAVMRGRDSVRDVIAFPKSGRGEDVLVKSPNRLTEEQLGTYHLRLKD